MSADTGLETRIAEGDLHFLDGLVLLGTIASQRWFGGKSRDVLDARVLDAGVAPEGPEHQPVFLQLRLPLAQPIS